MSTWLCETAKVGDPIEFRGPMRSFYPRPIERPALFLAGGAGLAPFLSMLDKIVEDGGSPYPIHMILGVNSDEDLVGIDRLETYAQRLPNFTYACTVTSPDSASQQGLCDPPLQRFSAQRWRCRCLPLRPAADG